jgi:hypothetical protein
MMGDHMPSIESTLSQSFTAREMDEIRDLVRKAYEEGFDEGIETREEIKKKDFHARHGWDWETKWWGKIQDRKSRSWLTSLAQSLMCRLIGHK